MDPHWTRRFLGALALGLGACALSSTAASAIGLRRHDPAQVIPLDQVAPEYRDNVAEVIRDHSFHRQGKPETFPCNAKIYLSLLNEPALTLALWQDLSTTPARLKQIAPDLYQGTDGAGTTATWRFVLRSSRLHVLLCDLSYVTPRGNARLEGRIVLIVRSGYFREVNGDPWVQHEIEAYVKIDSKGWKAVAITVRPLIEKLLEQQVEEAGWFVSLMGRLVAMYPNWATSVTVNQTHIAPEVRKEFRDLIIQTRKPGAFAGRPVLAENVETNTKSR